MYFLLWVGFIDYVNHRTESCDAAKITYADTGITMSEIDPSHGSCTDNEEANVSETERLSYSQSGLFPAPYSFEPSDTDLESFSENSSDDSDHSRLSDLSW